MASKHFLQTKSWAQVRELQGHQIVWIDDALMTVKHLSFPFKSFGYMSQVNLADLNWEKLAQQSRALNLSHVLLDSNDSQESFEVPKQISGLRITPAESVYYRATLLVDLTKSEDDLLQEMHKKHRYNIRVAEKHDVKFEVRDDEAALEIFLQLFFETVARQKYFGRDRNYYRQIWQVLQPQGKAKIAVASYQGQPLVAWMLFLENDTIYYPYGGSSTEYRNTMAANGLVWGLIKWGKEQGYTTLDLWGIDPAGTSEREKPHGFTRFKLGFGGTEVNYLNSQALIVSPASYLIFKTANAVRWGLLKLRKLLA